MTYLQQYILVGRTPFKCHDSKIWHKFMDSANREVKFDSVNGVKISTVFIGFDYMCGRNPPRLFETMVFGGEQNGYLKRYISWNDAEEGHEEVKELVLKSCKKSELENDTKENK